MQETYDTRLEIVRNASRVIQEKKDRIVLECLYEYLGRPPTIEDLQYHCRVVIWPDKEVFLFDDNEYLEIYRATEHQMEENILTLGFNWRRIK